MKYLLDFDRTLFDTDRFIAMVTADGKQDLMASKEVWEHYEAKDYLFSEVEDFLKSKNKDDVFIVTAINSARAHYAMSYQKNKVEQEPIVSLVREVVYVLYEKDVVASEIAKQCATDETIIFVDDLLEQCSLVKKALPAAHCFLMVRNPTQAEFSAADLNDLHIVQSLLEVDAIIKSL